MRLALYSDQVIAANAPMDERLVRLIATKHPRIGYVSSAPDPSRSYFEEKRAYYRNLGVELTMYMDSESEHLDEDVKSLWQCDAIHLSGGNTFSFLSWLRARGVLPILRAYAERDRGVLIGTSAGAILMTPTVATAALCGDERPAGFSDDTALGLVDFMFWPHYQPDSSSGISPDSHHVVYGCEDGTGVIVDRGAVELFGAVRVPRRSA